MYFIQEVRKQIKNQIKTNKKKKYHLFFFSQKHMNKRIFFFAIFKKRMEKHSRHHYLAILIFIWELKIQIHWKKFNLFCKENMKEQFTKWKSFQKKILHW